MTESPPDHCPAEGVVSLNLVEIALLGPLPRGMGKEPGQDPRIRPSRTQVLKDMDSLLGVGIVADTFFGHIIQQKYMKRHFELSADQKVLYNWLALAVQRGVTLLRERILEPEGILRKPESAVLWCSKTTPRVREVTINDSLGGAATRQSDASAAKKGGLTTLCAISVTVPESFALLTRKLIFSAHGCVGHLDGSAPSSELWNVRVETTPSWDVCTSKASLSGLLDACDQINDRMAMVRLRIASQHGPIVKTDAKGNVSISFSRRLHRGDTDAKDSSALVQANLQMLKDMLGPEESATLEGEGKSEIRPSRESELKAAATQRKQLLDEDIRSWATKYLYGASDILHRQVRAVQADYNAQAPWYGSPPVSRSTVDVLLGLMAQEEERSRLEIAKMLSDTYGMLLRQSGLAKPRDPMKDEDAKTFSLESSSLKPLTEEEEAREQKLRERRKAMALLEAPPRRKSPSEAEETVRSDNLAEVTDASGSGLALSASHAKATKEQPRRPPPPPPPMEGVSSDLPPWLPAYFIWERVEPSPELERLANPQLHGAKAATGEPLSEKARKLIKSIIEEFSKDSPSAFRVTAKESSRSSRRLTAGEGVGDQNDDDDDEAAAAAAVSRISLGDLDDDDNDDDASSIATVRLRASTLTVRARPDSTTMTIAGNIEVSTSTESTLH